MTWRNQLLWAGVALLSYLIGSFGFLAVVFSAGLFESGVSAEALSAADMAWILVCVALFALGGYATWRIRRTNRPEPSPLPSQFRSGPSADGTRPESPPDPDPAAGPSSDDAAVRCPECGARNDPGYTFCRNCSAKLSE